MYRGFRNSIILPALTYAPETRHGKSSNSKDKCIKNDVLERSIWINKMRGNKEWECLQKECYERENTSCSVQSDGTVKHSVEMIWARDENAKW